MCPYDAIDSECVSLRCDVMQYATCLDDGPLYLSVQRLKGQQKHFGR